MSKKRLHELAKELGIKSPELISLAEENGMDKLFNVSMLNEEQVVLLRKAFEKKNGISSKKEPEKTEKKADKVEKKPVEKSEKSEKTEKAEKPEKVEKKPSEKTEVPKKPEAKADEKPARPEGRRRKKKKTTVVFTGGNQQSGAYSTDQGFAYTPRLPREGEPTTKVKVEYSNAKAVVGSEDEIHSVEGEAVKPDVNKGDAEGDANKKKKPNPKSILGTVSTTDYSRPMPKGRPSVVPSRGPAPGRPSRGPAAGRPSHGGDHGRRDRDSRTPFAGKPGQPKTATGRANAAWKKVDSQPFMPQDGLTKTTGKRARGHKRKDAPIDRDKLDKRAKNSRKRDAMMAGDFDFGKKRKQKSQKYKQQQNRERSEHLDALLQKETVYIPEEITVKEFAEKINKSSSEIIMKLMGMGKMLTLNNMVDYETAALIAMDYNIDLDVEREEDIDYAEEFELDFEDKEEDLRERAPVVTVMGHVDHGKTSLLDAIRNTGIAEGEAGGITQHIGASEIVKDDKKILFLDTPGHEAFTTLRARGAQVTDIAVLVVAADDGVMPQTIEAIDHAKAAGVPIIVAINKIDKPAANVNRVKQELSDKGVLIEEWGGDTVSVEVSAKTGEGIDKLLEMILLVAEVLDLKSNPDRPAIGTVIDAKMVTGRGVVTTVLVEKGTLHQGDNFVAGRTFGRIRTMMSTRYKKIDEVGPSGCVEIDGISDIPNAGEKFYVTPDEKTAKQVANKYDLDHRRKLMKSSSVRLEELFEKIKEGSVKELAIIVKADVQGSVEALKSSILKLSTDEVNVDVIRAEVGTISESDVILASASHAVIIGFNVRPSTIVSTLAESEGVDIRTYSVIYQAIDDVENALKGMLEPIYKEVATGRAEVRDTFKIPGTVVAGSYVTSGKIGRNAGVRVIRDGIVLFTGKISSLRRFKDDVKEVAQGFECGIGIEKFSDIQVGDELEAFVMEEIKR